MAHPDAALLAQGIARLGLAIDVAQQQQLLAYLDLLQKWNRAYNLTAVRDRRQMVVRHLLDSLAILPHVDSGSLLDVGTGAGIPGIMLAICRPHQAFTLLDSNGKKTRFVRQVAIELGLGNVTVVQQRVEQYPESFSQVCCRAFAALPALLAICAPRLAAGGRILAMKAQTQPPVDGWQQQQHELWVPGLHETRHLLVLTRQGE